MKNNLKKSKINDNNKVLILTFMEKLKPKKAYDVLYDFIEDENKLNFNEVAIEISSLLTHSLIAVEEDDRYFDALDIPRQVEILEKYINGDCTKEEVRDFYETIFSV